MCKSIEVVNYFLRLPEGNDVGDAISNMKLQKLLYFAQGYALATLGRPLFEDDFEAWKHGPVIPDIYHQFKKYGGGAIPAPRGVNIRNYKSDERNLLHDVWLTFGRYSAWGLSELSHATEPWKRYSPTESVIPKKEMQAYFRSLYEKEQE